MTSDAGHKDTQSTTKGMGAVLPESRIATTSKAHTWTFQTTTPFIALATLMVVFYALNPNFLSAYNASNLLRQSSVLLVLAVASTFVILMGSIDLSIGSIVSLSAAIG